MSAPRRVAVTARIPEELATAVRGFVRDQAGRPMYLSWSGFVEEAFTRHLAYLRRRAENPAEIAVVPVGPNGGRVKHE